MTQNESRIRYLYEQTNVHPPDEESPLTLEMGLINSVVSVTGITWEQAVRSLIEQAHRRCVMPTERVCLTDLLRANGMIPRSERGNAADLFPPEGPEEKRYILLIGGLGYFALHARGDVRLLRGIPEMDASVLPGLLRRNVSEIWEYVPGSDTRAVPTKTDSSCRPIPEADRLVSVNLNPNGNYTGDCYLRALAGVLGCGWHEALDAAARATRYTCPTVNRDSYINLVLTRLGFEHHKGLRRGNRMLSGAEFCAMLDCTYRNGERVFAMLGRSHCAAVLPTTGPDGRVTYRIRDTWDSTRRFVPDWWTYLPPAEGTAPAPAQTAAPPVPDIGARLVHPSFGEGVITALSGDGKARTVTVRFPDSGEKKFPEIWLRAKGVIR